MHSKDGPYHTKKGTTMDITAYQQEVKTRNVALAAERVLAEAVTVAERMGYDFVDPSHVLLAILRRSPYSALENRLVNAGITVEKLDLCARVLHLDQNVAYSRIATARMFSRAVALAEPRYPNHPEHAELSLGDLVIASVLSESRVIDTVIRDDLETSIYAMLIQLQAPRYIFADYFPATTVEDILNTRMSSSAKAIFG